jgi:putative intracellular protease/amidase
LPSKAGRRQGIAELFRLSTNEAWRKKTKLGEVKEVMRLLLVDGKNVAVFTDQEEKIIQLDAVVPYMLESTLVAQGATSVSKAPWTDAAVVGQRLVTGQNPQSASSLGKLVVEELNKLR